MSSLLALNAITTWWLKLGWCVGQAGGASRVVGSARHRGCGPCARGMRMRRFQEKSSTSLPILQEEKLRGGPPTDDQHDAAVHSMPADLTDYCRVNGVELHDGLTPEQVTELLEGTDEKFARARRAVLRKLPAHERSQLSGIALLHAQAATHGRGCALSHVKKGPLPNGYRDAVQETLYRRLSGDFESSREWIVAKSLELHRLRTRGGEKPSPGMRKSFSRMTLAPPPWLGRIGGAERLKLKWEDGRTLHSKNPDLDVRGLVAGSMLLVKAPSPPDGEPRWFQARVRGFCFRCGLPPVLITFVATKDGDRNVELLPTPLDSACRKHDAQEIAPVQVV